MDKEQSSKGQSSPASNTPDETKSGNKSFFDKPVGPLAPIGAVLSGAIGAASNPTTMLQDALQRTPRKVDGQQLEEQRREKLKDKFNHTMKVFDVATADPMVVEEDGAKKLAAHSLLKFLDHVAGPDYNRTFSSSEGKDVTEEVKGAYRNLADSHRAVKRARKDGTLTDRDMEYFLDAVKGAERVTGFSYVADSLKSGEEIVRLREMERRELKPNEKRLTPEAIRKGTQSGALNPPRDNYSDPSGAHKIPSGPERQTGEKPKGTTVKDVPSR